MMSAPSVPCRRSRVRIPQTRYSPEGDIARDSAREVAMVCVDEDLVTRAYACITDRESSHRIGEMVFVYKLAVDLHNRQLGSHVNYQNQYELNLRAFVVEAEQKRA